MIIFVIQYLGDSSNDSEGWPVAAFDSQKAAETSLREVARQYTLFDLDLEEEEALPKDFDQLVEQRRKRYMVVPLELNAGAPTP